MNKQSLNSLFTGKVMIQLDEVDSTNTFAKEIITKTNPIEGTAIRADFQTHGRGQYGRIWHSDKAVNLMLSVIYKPKFLEIHRSFFLSILCSLALEQSLKLFLGVTHEIRIKWPNDIYVDGKKIAGILIENTLKGQVIEYSILGIGVNVNQHLWSENEFTPTSIYELKKQEFDIISVMNALLESLEKYYLDLKTGKFDQLLKQYNDLLFCKNESIEFTRDQNGINEKGIIDHVDEKGCLALLTKSGLEKFCMHQIKWKLPHKKD